MKKEKVTENVKMEEKKDRVVIDEFPGAKTIETGNAFRKSYVFKLLKANMLKNFSFNPKDPILVPMEHAHIYRTVDSSGKSLTACNHVGGHYHEVTVNWENDQWIVECSPAISGKNSNELIPNDNHTHKGINTHTEYVQVRTTSLEAINMINNFLKEPAVKE